VSGGQTSIAEQLLDLLTPTKSIAPTETLTIQPIAVGTKLADSTGLNANAGNANTSSEVKTAPVGTDKKDTYQVAPQTFAQVDIVNGTPPNPIPPPPQTTSGNTGILGILDSLMNTLLRILEALKFF
jgi:hypothetical protein